MTDSNLQNTVPDGAFAIGSKSTDDFTKNEEIKKLVNHLANHELNICITQEREFVKTISGDCNSPIGVISRVDKDKFTLTGYVSDIKGCSFIKSKYECKIKDSMKAGRIFGKIFIQQGAKKLLES